MAFINRYSDFMRCCTGVTVAVVVVLLSACSAGIPVRGSHYVHRLYRHPAISSADQKTLIIYIEGDGVPWVDRGTRPAADPTPIHALAYQLYKTTPYAAWYVGRPCYNQVKDTMCTPLLWTHQRYSEQVVDSMVAVINRNIESTPYNSQVKRVILVGYSGGGTLALLMAPRIPQVAGV